MSDPTDVHAELRLAEERLAEVRARNARLERTLLKPTGLRNRAIATLALSALGGALAYVGATRAGDARAAEARARLVAQYEDLFAGQRRAVDACKGLVQMQKSDTLACSAQRDQLLQIMPPRPLDSVRVISKCNCQLGDPLCSCL